MRLPAAATPLCSTSLVPGRLQLRGAGLGVSGVGGTWALPCPGPGQPHGQNLTASPQHVPALSPAAERNQCPGVRGAGGPVRVTEGRQRGWGDEGRTAGPLEVGTTRPLKTGTSRGGCRRGLPRLCPGLERVWCQGGGPGAHVPPSITASCGQPGGGAARSLRPRWAARSAGGG